MQLRGITFDIIAYRISVYSFLAQLVERVTSNDEVSRSSRLEGIFLKPDLSVYSHVQANNRSPTVSSFLFPPPSNVC